jgi:hypothetical protein
MSDAALWEVPQQPHISQEFGIVHIAETLPIKEHFKKKNNKE